MIRRSFSEETTGVFHIYVSSMWDEASFVKVGCIHGVLHGIFFSEFGIGITNFFGSGLKFG